MYQDNNRFARLWNIKHEAGDMKFTRVAKTVLWAAGSWLLTLQTVVKLVQVSVLLLLAADDLVVGDVAVRAFRGLPLQDDLRGGVGGGDGVQRHRGLWKAESKR